MALAVAAAFGVFPAGAQPTGAQAIHGSATVTQSGNQTTITTTNGAGTRHSSINWQSFSVPTGSLTQFNQPSSTSTSINRVVGSDPSSIFGTLRSNGTVVLVNPAGIAFGPGSVVDTAGFTASTLRMSDADALAGRLAFGADGAAGGALQADGQIVARQGDVVLIASNLSVGSTALIQAPNGTTALVAGQKVEITGRGLEGIRLEVQAPADSAVNLGRLEGDAVGIFAGTLRHSGAVHATAVTSEGGKVVLRAAGGDALVAGSITAAGPEGRGGSIDVLGQRVGLLAGARLDASGANGGGQIRVGGDFQGKNPDVMNAQRTYVDRNATIRADATDTGDGGRIIVWADDQTASYGRISARGGANGGDGGFVEVSGKRALAFDSAVDTTAARGRIGTLLLDPVDIRVFNGGTALLDEVDQFADLGVAVAISNDIINASTTTVVLQAENSIDIDAAIAMTGAAGFTAQAGGGINVNASITTAGGAVNLTSGDLGGAPASTSYLNVFSNITTNGGAINLKVDGNASEGSINIASTATLASGGGAMTLKSSTLDVGGNGIVVSGALNSGTGALLLESQDIWINGGSVTRTGGGDLTLVGQQMRIGGSLNGGAGRVVFRTDAASKGRVIAVGGGDDGTELSLDATELGFISAKTLVFGDAAQTGGVRVDAFSAAGVSELSLITQGAITQTGAITVSGLNADGGDVLLTAAGNSFNTLSGYARGGDFSVTSTAGMRIGTVDGQSGIDAGGGSVYLTAFTLDQDESVRNASLLSVTASFGVNLDLLTNSFDTVSVSNGATSTSGNVVVRTGGTLSGAYINNYGTGGTTLFAGGDILDAYVQSDGVGAVSLSAGGDARYTYVNTRGGLSMTTGGKMDLGDVEGSIVAEGAISAVAGGSMTVTNALASNAGNVQLTGAGIILNPFSNVTAAGSLTLDGAGGSLALGGGSLSASGLIALNNAKDVHLGNVSTSGALGLNAVSGSVTQEASTWVTASGGLSVSVSGSVILNDAFNRVGYVSGSAGGNIDITGVGGVDVGGISAGGNLTLTSPPTQFTEVITFLDAPLAVAIVPSGFMNLIGSVTAGGTATLRSAAGVAVNTGSTVTAPAIVFDSPYTDVYGSVQPGGAGGLGTMTATGSLYVAPGGSVQLDVASLTSFDTLTVAGDSYFDIGGTVQVNDLSGGTLNGTFQPTSMGSGFMYFALPTGWSVTNPFSTSYAVSTSPSAPIPTVYETESFAVTFQETWNQEQQEEETALGKDDIVITETQCKA